MPTRGALTATALGEPRTEGCALGAHRGGAKGGSMRGLGGGGGGDGDGGAGGWLVGRFGGGCIGVVPSVRRQEGHRHTGRIRPHQSILRVQGHRPTNYPGLIDARRWRKKVRSLYPPVTPLVTLLLALLPISARPRFPSGRVDHDRSATFRNL